jgi:hypothetical protein
VEQVEDRLAAELGLDPGKVLLDYPTKPQMLELDLPLLTSSGETELLTFEGSSGLLGIQRVAEELHIIARRLRVFSADPIKLNERALMALVERSAEEVSAALDAGEALLG